MVADDIFLNKKYLVKLEETDSFANIHFINNDKITDIKQTKKILNEFNIFLKSEIIEAREDDDVTLFMYTSSNKYYEKHDNINSIVANCICLENNDTESTTYTLPHPELLISYILNKDLIGEFEILEFDSDRERENYIKKQE